jgi:hypothetical protein
MHGRPTLKDSEEGICHSYFNLSRIGLLWALPENIDNFCNSSTWLISLLGYSFIEEREVRKCFVRLLRTEKRFRS